MRMQIRTFQLQKCLLTDYSMRDIFKLRGIVIDIEHPRSRLPDISLSDPRNNWPECKPGILIH